MSLTTVDTDTAFAFAPSTSSNIDLLAMMPAKDNSALLLSHAAGVNELELNFFDEFLLHDELVPDPHSPAPSDGAASPLADASLAPAAASADVTVDVLGREDYAAAGIGASADASALSNASLLAFGGSSSPSSASPSSPSSSGASSGDDEPAHTAGSSAPVDRKAKRRAQVAISARRHRCRKKHELLELRSEVSALQAQLAALRSRHRLLRPEGAVAEWEERAVAQRLKRRQTEEQNAALRRAVFMQGSFLHNLGSLFQGAAMASAELDMRQLLHTYTRLGTNARARQRDYEAICSDAKLDLAIDVLSRETAALDVRAPNISTRPLRAARGREFGATTVAAYAFDTLDMRRIFVAACAAIRDSGRDWPQYAPVDARVQVVDAPRENVRYGVSSIRYRSDAPGVAEDEGEVEVESRAISYYRVTEAYGVLLWDFVDVDDLYPLAPSTTMKRDVVGAVLVRREVCADGVERVVCRSLCTKIHSFDCAPSTPRIQRFSQSTELGSGVCGSFVYNSIRNEYCNGAVPAV